MIDFNIDYTKHLLQTECIPRPTYPVRRINQTGDDPDKAAVHDRLLLCEQRLVAMGLADTYTPK